jgi:hypothetical protein
VSEDKLNIDDELARLARASEAVSARPDFTARVMAAVQQQAATTANPGVLEQVGLGAWRVLPFVATLAALVVALASQVEPEADDEFAVQYGAMSTSELAYSDLALADLEVSE